MSAGCFYKKMNDLNNQIKNAIDIADIIGERVTLRKTARGYVGLCPFHEEKTPSFNVFNDTQSYYCFGCQAAGDIFTFVMKTEGLTFIEARNLLAARAGIEITSSKKNSNGPSTLKEILDEAEKFFAANLANGSGAGAREYMSHRGLDLKDLNRFSIGYSQNSWDSLVNYLREKKIPDEKILNAGLALQNNRGGLYDRFRGRVIFPIKDITGRIIAFGGRLIEGDVDAAKYINSPENEIYSKRKNLYLLDSARRYIRDKGRSILVEGYMDAISLHKAGFNESVASLGTSLTPEQAELLSRYADRCYICYDSDKAGKNATIRGMYILQQHGLDVQVVSLPEGKDPDEFLKANPPEKFEDAIKNSVPLVVAHIRSLTSALNNPATQKSAMKELLAGLSRLKANDLLPHLSYLSELTMIPPTELKQKLLSGEELTLPEIKMPSTKILIESKEDQEEKNSFEAEAGLCALLFHSRDCRLSMKPEEVYKILRSPLTQETAVALLTENPEELSVLWLSIGDTGKAALIARGDIFCENIKASGVKDLWKKIYGDLKIKWVDRRIEEIKSKLRQGTAPAEDQTELSELLDMKKILQK